MKHTKEEYHQIYYEYSVELNQYTLEDISDMKECNKFCDNIFRQRYYTWNDIENDKGDLIGFLVTSVPPECHPDADYHIAQAYVKPEYRKQGYMTKAVHKQLKAFKGIWCLLILKDNEYAHQFWRKTFESAGYKWTFLMPAVLQGDNGDLCQTAYAPYDMIGF